MFRMLWLGVACLASGLLFEGTASAQHKFGVVDVQKVMEATPAWTKAVGVLKRDWEKTRSDLESKQDALRKEKEALDQKRIVADPKSMMDEDKRLLERANQFRMALMQAQQQFTQREAQLKDAMLTRVERIVYAIAEADDYTYIFETGTPETPNVLFAAKGIDLTDQVVARYKKEYGDQSLDSDIGKAVPTPGEQPKTN